MRLSIVHEIVQEFAPAPKALIEVLRLRPKDFECQHVTSWRVDVDVDCSIREGRDAFGNLTQTLDCERPASKLTIVARGEIDTFDTAGMLRGGEPERFPLDVFLRDTDLTTAEATVRDFATTEQQFGSTTAYRRVNWGKVQKDAIRGIGPADWLAPDDVAEAEIASDQQQANLQKAIGLAAQSQTLAAGPGGGGTQPLALPPPGGAQPAAAPAGASAEAI